MEIIQPVSSTDDRNIEWIDNPHGIPVPVRVFGKNTEGTPVLMIHGLQSHSGWFVQSGDFLGRIGVPVYLIDRYGSGLSPAPRGECRDWRMFVDDIDAVAARAMKYHRKDQVHILGHCLGALGAALFACERPHEIKSLILTSAGMFTKVDVTLKDKLKIVYARIFQQDIQIPVPLKPGMFSEIEEYVSYVAQDPLALSSVSARLYYEIFLVRWMVRFSKGKITMPVFMANAGDDPVSDNEKNEKFLESLPVRVKKLVRYENARHILEYSSEKERFFGDLAGWLRELGEKVSWPA